MTSSAISTVWAQILATGIIPVFYHDDPDLSREVLQACYQGGIRVFEYTHRGEAALENFRGLKAFKDRDMPDLWLGIGTIKTPGAAETYLEAGADFLVSPLVHSGIAEKCRIQGRLWIPGCMTPTEIAQAEALGAPLVKLFPGELLGPGFVRAIRPLFPELRMMPTGGVDPSREGLSSWLKAGVSACGLGSRLITAEILQNRDMKALTARCRMLLDLFSELAAAR